MIDVRNNLYCDIRIHTDITNVVKISDKLHTKRITQKSAKYRLTLKCFLLRNVKFIIPFLFELPFSSSVSCSPLAFLKDISMGSVELFDDINDDFAYVHSCESRHVFSNNLA